MARLPYPDQTAVSEAMRDLPEQLQRTNIGRMLSHAPSALPPYYTLSFALLGQLELDPKVRQVAILYVTRRIDAQYAWVQHVAISRLVGLGDLEIGAIERGETDATCFTAQERLAMSLAGELLVTPRVSDELFERVRTAFSAREIVELLLVVGWYWTVGRLMRSLDLEPDPPVVGDR